MFRYVTNTFPIVQLLQNFVYLRVSFILVEFLVKKLVALTMIDYNTVASWAYGTNTH